MEIQRGNCASILGTVESPNLLEELFELFDRPLSQLKLFSQLFLISRQIVKYIIIILKVISTGLFIHYSLSLTDKFPEKSKKDRIAPPKMYIDIECCVRTLFLSKCLSRLQKRTEAHCF